MKKLYTILFLFLSFFAFSQNNGINFQGVGRNSSGAVLATQRISLRFSVIQGSETGSVEYVESKEVTTNAQGIFSVVIGDGTQISKTGNFTDINWKINPKFLKVEMDPAGGSSFATMGTTRLQAVPFAYYANGVNAENVDGVLSASKGGTGVASISALKTALGVDQINNTSDLAKPISTATQTALDTKVSTATFSTTLATKANVADVALKAPLESPTFTGTVSGITKAMIGLSNAENTADLAKPISTATQAALDMKVSTATFSTTLDTKANVADVTLKAPLESPTFTGTVSGITKSMVGLSNVENTADLAKPISTATQAALETKVSTATFSTTLSTKANLADVALKAPLESPTFTGTVSGITKAMVGLSDVENTADLAKPISTATQTALDNKLDVSTAEAAFARLDQSNQFHRDQSIEGGLTVNRINFPGNNNTYLEAIPIPMSDELGLNIANDNFVSIGKLTPDDSNGWRFDTFDNKIVLPNGTQIKSGNASETIFQLTPDTDFTIKTSIDGYNRSLQFDKDGYLNFSDGGRINDDENRFEVKADDKRFEINIFNSVEEHSYSWKFDQNGNLNFPDGTTLARSFLSSNFFELKTGDNDGFKITNSDDPDNPQTWTFGLDGNMIFPGGDYIENDTYRFGITTENKRFQVGISDSPNMSTFYWRFWEDGKLEFPDGSKFGAPEGDGTTGFIAADNTSFLIETNNTSNNATIYSVWDFTKDGAVVFPDGTITSGTISGTNNFGFDTSPTNNGFSIITAGTSSGTTNLWSFETDGSLKFPNGTITSGTISGTSNFGFDTRATENGFSILTGTSTGTAQLWTFDTDGNLNLPAGGNIKIGGTSVLSNFLMEVFQVENVHPTTYSFTTNNRITGNGSVWEFELENVPLANQTAFYINGIRARTNIYTITNNKLIINMRSWDNPAQSNYEFSIDYKY